MLPKRVMASEKTCSVISPAVAKACSSGVEPVLANPRHPPPKMPEMVSSRMPWDLVTAAKICVNLKPPMVTSSRTSVPEAEPDPYTMLYVVDEVAAEVDAAASYMVVLSSQPVQGSDASHKSELPVSKMTSNVFAGVPTLIAAGRDAGRSQSRARGSAWARIPHAPRPNSEAGRANGTRRRDVLVK